MSRRYNVSIEINGEVKRQVLANNAEDAIRKVIKSLFAADDVTPKSNAVQAFFWQRRYCTADVDFLDWNEEEQAAHDAEMRAFREEREKKAATEA